MTSKRTTIILRASRAAACLAGFFAVSVAGCGAGPRDVCDHIERVVSAEAGSAAATEAVDGCAFTWETRQETKGAFAYKALADCVMASEDLAALAQCK